MPPNVFKVLLCSPTSSLGSVLVFDGAVQPSTLSLLLKMDWKDVASLKSSLMDLGERRRPIVL